MYCHNDDGRPFHTRRLTTPKRLSPKTAVYTWNDVNTARTVCQSGQTVTTEVPDQTTTGAPGGALKNARRESDGPSCRT